MHAIVLVSKVHKPTMRALAYARVSRPNSLEALTVEFDPAQTEALMKQWEDLEIPIPLKVVNSPYRELVRPVIRYVKELRKSSPRDIITVYIPEYVVGKWWEQLLHNQTALRLKGRLLFMPGVMVTSVPYQLSSAGRAKKRLAQGSSGTGRRPPRIPGPLDMSDDPIVDVGPIAHGGHCVARLDGQVVFVRHTLPGERVRIHITDRSKSFLRADAVEVIEAAPGRVEAPCPYAGPGLCGGCDFQHVDPATQRGLLGDVVREQLRRLAGITWDGRGRGGRARRAGLAYARCSSRSTTTAAPGSASTARTRSSRSTAA